MTLDRKIGVRTAYVVLSVAVWFATLFALSAWTELDDSQVFDALEWLLGVLGLAVGGDTLRPSGRAVGAFGVAPTAAPAEPAAE